MSRHTVAPDGKPPSDPLRRDERHRQFGPLLEFSPDAIVIVDADGLVREWNPAAAPMLQTTNGSAARTPLLELLSTPHRESFEEAWLELLAEESLPHLRDPRSMEFSSEPRIDVTVAPIRWGETLAGAVVILRNQAAVDSVRGAAIGKVAAPGGSRTPMPPGTVEYDAPGGLPGRHWLQQRLSEPPAKGLERGVAVFDIDAFAEMVATYGSDAADAVLTEFGELLRGLDTPGTFAHWRADSFAWIVDVADPAPLLDQCTTALLKALEEPFLVGEDRVWLTLSIGLATTTLVVEGDLLASASDARQSAKHSGGSRALYYEDSMEANATSGFRLANDLHHAITHDELRLHYQPIMEFATNEITGVEALVRWERPGVGMLAPDLFIDAAERTGQIVQLGKWVVRTACQNARRLGSHSGGPRTMSINISARQLRDPGLIATLREAMLENECAPSTITIEVTESVLLEDFSTIVTSLEEIKSLDIGVDLDDFGTGYSSLQYLRNLPIDRLKVDQGFVAGLGVNGADTAIVASTIALAHALGLRSIAEGVETTEQLALLREMGCDFAQGYLLSRPVEMETFTAWLEAYVPAEAFPPAIASDAESSRNRGDAADRRDVKANRRDAMANRRDAKADARDATATTRDGKASTRDATADERERLADLRDAVATAREHAEDDREQARGSTGEAPPDEESQ